MKNYQTNFAVQQLRTKNIVKGIESLSGFVAAVVANMLIPQLLIKYVYDPTKLVAAPPVFEYLPLFTYGLALLYFIFAMVGNFLRERNARTMEKELALSSSCANGHCHDGSCCGTDNDNDEISEKELEELEKIVDEALKPTKKSAKKSAKKSNKKTSKKKTK